MRSSSQLHFLFIGFGGKKAWLKQAVEDRGLKNVSILDYQTRSELSYSLNACDISIISLAEGMAGVSVPSRIYNVMAAGKPIIAVADAYSEVALVVKENDVGWVVPPGDVDGLCVAILEAKADPNLLVQMGQRARNAAETKYSFEAVNQAYTEMVASILEETA
jgi:glycosyltransferase involved in cell wall biosynthesis